MNAERLHAIVKELRAEMDSLQLVATVQNLVNGLRAVVQQSNQSTQQNLASYISTLDRSLTDTTVDRFSPTWKQVLKEIAGDDLFGSTLKQNIDQILSRNQLTPSVAADEIDKIRVRMERFNNALNQAISAFAAFNVGDETLAPGECEIGMLIPRGAVDNRMLTFAEELQEFGFILNTFSEVATDKPDDLSIITISSSDLLVYLSAAAPYAACVAVAVERVVALYKQLLEIRKLEVELENQGIPEQAREIVEQHANTHMERGIEKLSVEIVQQYHKGKDSGRKNELTNGVRISLNKIANRIDRGYNIEVRCEPVADSETSENTQTREAIAAIQTASENMQFLKLDGRPILKLPEKTGQSVAKTKKKTSAQKESAPDSDGKN